MNKKFNFNFKNATQKNIFRKIKFDRKIVVLNSIEIKTSDWNWLLGALYDAVEPLSLFIFPC